MGPRRGVRAVADRIPHRAPPGHPTSHTRHTGHGAWFCRITGGMPHTLTRNAIFSRDVVVAPDAAERSALPRAVAAASAVSAAVSAAPSAPSAPPSSRVAASAPSSPFTALVSSETRARVSPLHPAAPPRGLALLGVRQLCRARLRARARHEGPDPIGSRAARVRARGHRRDERSSAEPTARAMSRRCPRPTRMHPRPRPGRGGPRRARIPTRRRRSPRRRRHSRRLRARRTRRGRLRWRRRRRRTRRRRPGSARRPPAIGRGGCSPRVPRRRDVPRWRRRGSRGPPTRRRARASRRCERSSPRGAARARRAHRVSRRYDPAARLVTVGTRGRLGGKLTRSMFVCNLRRVHREIDGSLTRGSRVGAWRVSDQRWKFLSAEADVDNKMMSSQGGAPAERVAAPKTSTMGFGPQGFRECPYAHPTNRPPPARASPLHPSSSRRPPDLLPSRPSTHAQATRPRRSS